MLKSGLFKTIRVNSNESSSTDSDVDRSKNRPNPKISKFKISDAQKI